MKASVNESVRKSVKKFLQSKKIFFLIVHSNLLEAFQVVLKALLGLKAPQSIIAMAP